MMKCSNCGKGKTSTKPMHALYWREEHGFCNIDCYKDWVKKGRPTRLPNKEAED